MGPSSPVDLLVPLPRRVELREGSFPLDGVIAFGRAQGPRSPALERLARELETQRCSLAEGEGTRRLELLLEPGEHGREGYRLSIEPWRITLTAATTSGLDHGLST